MNIKCHKIPRSDSGFTMIELMVSLLIAMILLGGVFQIFVKSSDGNRRLNGLAAVLDNGRFAMSFMQTTIQGAGFRGCRANATITNNLNNAANYAYNFAAQPIIGYDAGAGAWTPALDPGLLPPLPVGVAAPLASMPGFPGSPGADIITVRGITGPADVVTAPMATTASAITLSGNNSFGQGSLLLVSDCNGNADVFQKTDVAPGTAAHGVAVGVPPNGNVTPNLTIAYGTTASVVTIGTTTFYLGAGAAGPSSLWVRQGNAGFEMVEGVDGMQILYGITNNTDTSANRYLTANNVADWTKVVSVRIALLLRTVNTVTRQPDTNLYTLLGVNYPPGALLGNNIRYNDLRLRRIFTTTITLRNRSF